MGFGSADSDRHLAVHVPRLARRAEASGGTLLVEGSVLCADLSGFTRLSERFATVGRHGAEEVTAVLDAAFTAILGPAIDRGGDVLAFGGDAATIGFTDDGHAARAVGAAAAMQQALLAIARPIAPSRVRLRMTIGVATGPVLAELVGDRQRALVVVGETVARAVRLHHAASPGQVLVAGPQLAAPPGARWGPAVDDTTARRLDWRKARPGDVEVDVASETLGATAAALIPPMLRDTIRGTRTPGELRRTTTAFIVAPDVGEVDPPSWGSTRRRVEVLVSAIERATERWGVCWLATDLGEGSLSFILTAGTPVATGHYEERMVGAIGTVLESVPSDWIRVGL